MRIKRGLYVLGSTFLIIGTLLVLNSLSSITGFVIVEEINISIGRYIGLVIIILGILTLTAGKMSNRYLVGRLVGDYESGELNPVEVALKINEVLEGTEINGVDYRGGTNETLRTSREYIPIRVGNQDKAQDLALALYEVALINDRKNARNCELHINKKASSKHHRKGLDKLIKKFERRFDKDLKTARST
tara:strand:+ start:243 stop:812 length:570 start_codon:yes stop_codon:yes gene_type:complete